MTYSQTYDQGSLFMNYMNAKTYLESHRDDYIPSFPLAPYSTGYIKERIQIRAIVVVVDAKTLVIIAGPYEQLTPVNYSDGSGHMAILIAALLGFAIGAAIGSGVDFAKQMISNGGDISKVDPVSVLRQGINGGALGFAGGAGGAALGGFLAGTAGITGTTVLGWLGASSVVSFGGGVAAYSVEALGHNTGWELGEAMDSGTMGLVAGLFAFGAGGVSKLVSGSNLITKRLLPAFVKTVFKFPLQYVEGILIDYLA